MIKENELRIGSVVNYTTAEGDITPLMLDWQHLKWICEDPKGFNLVHHQIQITEELLVKCGAEKYEETKEWQYFIRISAAKLFIRISFGRVYMSFNDTYLGDMIKTVHRLQNFCAVFGKELEIKL